MTLAKKDVLPYGDSIGPLCPSKRVTRRVIVNANGGGILPNEALQALLEMRRERHIR